MDRKLNEQLLAVAQEKRRRLEDDPLKDFVPHKKQEEFAKDVLGGKVREAWALWANRTGKTQIGAWIDAQLARFGWDDPNSIYSGSGKGFIEVRDRATSGWVVSLDFPNSRDVVQTMIFDNGFCPPGATKPFIPKREIAEWRMTDQILKLKNGSIIGFKSADSPRVKFQGAGKDYIHFDEEPPQGHYDEATIRIQAGRKLIVFATCTLLPPEGEAGGVSWVFNAKVKPWQKGLSPEGVKIYQASIYDNPHIDREEIKFRESIYPAGTVQNRIRLQGELIPGVGGSRAYPGFETAIHVRETGGLNSRFPLCWCWDFNVEPLVTEIGQYMNGVFYVHEEICMESGSIPEMCDLFYDRYNTWQNEIIIYGDATGQNRGAMIDTTSYKLISSTMRNYRMHPKLRIPTRNPAISDRLNAMSHAFRNPQKEVTFFVNPSCKELINDFEDVLIDTHGGIKKSHNTKDAYYRRSHSSDAVGYWVCSEAPIRMRQKYTQQRNVKRTIPDVQYFR